MPRLSKRVQILLPPHQFVQLEEIARQQGRSIGALIRQAIEKEYLQERGTDRLKAIEEIKALNLPVANWEQMEQESRGECIID